MIWEPKSDNEDLKSEIGRLIQKNMELDEKRLYVAMEKCILLSSGIAIDIKDERDSQSKL